MVDTPIVLEKPELEPLAQRNAHAAILLGPMLPPRLECAAIYLSSQTSGWEEETHQLLLVTSGTIELLDCRVGDPEWFDRGGQEEVRRTSLVRSLTVVPLRAVKQVAVLEDGDRLLEGQTEEPRFKRSGRIDLEEDLGSLGKEISFPLRSNEVYAPEARTTPMADAGKLIAALLEALRSEAT